MAFTIFQKGYTVNADEKNNNFYHVGQGDRLPRGGQSLTATDSVYNIGDEDYYWDSVYCNNVNVGVELNDGWNLLYEETLNTTSSRIEITGLNGDEHFLYRILFTYYNTVALGQIRMVFNNDSSSNYGFQLFQINDTTTSRGVFGARDTSENGFLIGRVVKVTGTSNINFCDLYLYAKTGNERLSVNKTLNSGDEEYVYNYYRQSNIWNDTTNTITSITIYPSSGSNFVSGTNIQIWGIK